ncbi:MAG: glutamate--tRNA ligase [Thermoprotei archaeon]|nr:glutamate--tRNA ligase [Thermoprotei archaeon]
MEDVRDIVLKHALLNALRHNGKASEKAVLGKVIAEAPHLRKTIHEVRRIVSEVVKTVNSMSIEEQREVLERTYGREILEVSRKPRGTREGLPPLPGVEEARRKYGTITTRFAPAPTGALHIGQVVRAAMLSYLYAERYDGRMVLRIEDTDPRVIKKAYYQWILDDLRKLGIKWDQLIIVSDRFERHYEIAEKLIEGGLAYVCTCTADKFRKYKEACAECPDRNLSVEEHLRRWNDMLEGGYSEGEAVVRLKVDMSHPNPVLRDPPLLRIIESTPHPLKGFKYRVYPLYNFACAIEDHDSKVTHIIRAKEHEHNAAVQSEICKALGWEMPIAIQYGMVYLEGYKVHKRHIREGLRKGELSGWDDVRLPTIRALLRRGIQAEAIRRLAMELSLTPHDIKLSMETLYALNRKIVDPIANRYYFVEDPVKVVIEGAPLPIDVKIRLHPQHLERGFREYRFLRPPVEVYISRRDLEFFKEGHEVRLIELFNVRVKEVNEMMIKCTYIGGEVKQGIPKVHWVSEPYLHAEVMKPDGNVVRGIIEFHAQNIREGEIVQLERYAFARLERNEGEVLKFIYLHN